MRRLLPFVLLTLSACGGSPTGPSDIPTPTPVSGWPAGTSLSITSGRAGSPVAARVLLNGAPYSGQAAPAGSPVDISAPGFLARQTVVRTGETTLSLWPDDAGLPGEYTKTLVYKATRGNGLDQSARVAATSVSVVPSDQLRGDARALETHREAIDTLNAALGGQVTYQLDGAGSVRVTTRVNGSDPYCVGTVRALTYLQRGMGTITGAEIVFCFVDAARSSTVVHELGHTFGLRHSLDPVDVMGVRVDRRTTFSGKERLVMALMLQRRPGIEWPDNDRATTSASGRTVTVEVD